MVNNAGLVPAYGFGNLHNRVSAGAAQAFVSIFRRRLNPSYRTLLINTRLFLPAVVTAEDFSRVEDTAKYVVGSGALFIGTNFYHDSPPVVVINNY
jgi:hypothetical protein